MFQIIQTTKTFNRRGDVIATKDETVFETADPIESAKYRYERSEGGCFVSITNRQSVLLSTLYNGEKSGFDQLFRMVEGEEAYQDVLNDRRPPVAEQTWIAAKLAEKVA